MSRLVGCTVCTLFIFSNNTNILNLSISTVYFPTPSQTSNLESALRVTSSTNFIESPLLYRTMFSCRYRPLIHKLIFQSPLQRSNLGALSCPFSSSQIQNSHEKINLDTYKDWLSPNEVIKIFQNLKNPNSALTVLNQISKRKDYKPNEAIYSVVIKNLAIAKNFDAVDTLMEKIKNERKCRLSDDFFYNVIKIYGHFAGRINKAIDTLFDMPNYKCWPSVKTFNFVLNLLVNTKQFDVVDKVYMRGSDLGVEIDACCLNIIVKGLCRCGELDAAYKVFDEFPKQNCRPNVRTFSTIMHALCERGRVDEALGLFERMEKEDVEPDAIVFNTLISGLRKQRRVDEGIDMFKKVMMKGCDPNPGTYQEVLYALLDAKRFSEAKDFMGVMIDKRVNPSFESYKVIIHGLCDGKLLGDLDWVLRQMVRHGFVPRMGMWRKILGCVFPDGGCCTTYTYDEVLAD